MTTRRARVTRQERVVCLRSSTSARVPSFRASGARQAKAGAHGTRLAGLRCGDAARGRRNRRLSAPACSGAKAPTRVRGSAARLGVPAYRNGCRSRRTTPRSREALPAGKGASGRGPNPGRGRKAASARAQSASSAGGRGSKAPAPAKARAGRPKGRCGARVFARWKASSTALSAHLVHANGLGAVSAARKKAPGARAPGELEREATGMSEARSARTATGRQRPSR